MYDKLAVELELKVALKFVNQVTLYYARDARKVTTEGLVGGEASYKSTSSANLILYPEELVLQVKELVL